MYLSPSDASKAVAKPKAAVAKKDDPNALYTKDDYTAHFAMVATNSRDTFNPIVKRNTGSSGKGGAAATSNPALIPADFAGGEPNWSFTGMASIDGSAQALVENSTTKDGEFLKIGENWKTCVVTDITDDALTLTGPGGSSYVVRIKADFNDQIPVEQGGTGPMKVGANPLAGQIGSPDLTISPTDPNATMQDNGGNGGNNGGNGANRGRGRGRGNRGGGGGGGRRGGGGNGGNNAN